MLERNVNNFILILCTFIQVSLYIYTMNDNLKTTEMIKFEITYCYGGSVKGENILTKVIEATSEEAALIEFHSKWNSEVIISVVEIS